MPMLPGERQQKNHVHRLNKWVGAVAESLQLLTLNTVQTLHTQLFKKANTLTKMGKNKANSSEHTKSFTAHAKTFHFSNLKFNQNNRKKNLITPEIFFYSMYKCVVTQITHTFNFFSDFIPKFTSNISY